MLQNLVHDLRYAVRTLRKSPGFAVTAILTLALGIGANTAIFSILDPLLLRKLPVSRPEELVRVDAAGSLGNAGAWQARAYQRLRDHSPVFSGVMAFTPVQLDDVSHDGRSAPARAEIVSENYFAVLGLRPFAGRLIAQEQELGNVAVLGFDYWQREFGADTAALGKTMVAQGRALTVIGVAPPGFFGMKVGEAIDFYLPLAPSQALNPSGKGPSLDWILAIGRLNPGVSTAQAQAALQPVLREIQAESDIPIIEQHQMMDHIVLTSAARGLSNLRYRFSLPARILMCVVGLVLLIACSNVANLLLAQGSARRREITVRLALGAHRSRLVRQLMTESAVLAAVGAVAGLLAAQATSRLIVASLSDFRNHVVLATPLSARVLLFSMVSTVLAVLLCGLIPALSATRVDLSLDIKMNAAGRVHGAPARLGGFLVVGQVAMSVAALVAAGMLLHSLFNLETMDVGFDRDHILALDMYGMSGNSPEYTNERIASFYDRLLERARALPGVRSATLSSFAPVSGSMIGVNLRAEGYEPRPGEEPKAFLNGVTPGYFSTLGIDLLQGRDFAPQDSPSSPRVAIVNRSLARHYFGDRDPIGKRLEFVESGRKFEIVGVVADSKYYDLRENATDFMCLDRLQSPPESPVINGTLSVRAAGNAGALRNTLPEMVRSLDQSIRISRVATLRERIDDSIHADRVIAALCGSFSLLALLLTGIGLYGILSFSVARRTSEIGIRMALGAQRLDISRLVVGQGMRLVLTGLVLGTAAALAAAGLLTRLLFGVGRVDPLTLIGILLLLAVTAILACHLPARRATRVDPLVALRAD
jgi:predicted permease